MKYFAPPLIPHAFCVLSTEEVAQISVDANFHAFVRKDVERFARANNKNKVVVEDPLGESLMVINVTPLKRHEGAAE